MLESPHGTCFNHHRSLVDSPKAAGEVSKKLYELGKSLKDCEVKQQLDEILDNVRELRLQSTPTS